MKGTVSAARARPRRSAGTAGLGSIGGCSTRAGVQGHPDVGPDGQRPHHHPEPGGSPGRRRKRRAVDQGVLSPAAPGGLVMVRTAVKRGGVKRGEMAGKNIDVHSPDGSKGQQCRAARGAVRRRHNIALMHQVVTAQLAAARQGTHATKTRGHGLRRRQKPYRQGHRPRPSGLDPRSAVQGRWHSADRSRVTTASGPRRR